MIQTSYCWKRFVLLDGERTPRLFTPWNDTEYTYADEVFDTKEQAEEWKKDVAPDEKWVLCKETLETLSDLRMCPKCKETKKYDADVWRNIHTEPGRVIYTCGDCTDTFLKEIEDARPKDTG